MVADSLQALNEKIAADPEIQAKLRAIKSPMEFLSLAQTVGFDLTGADLQTLAQQAHQRWIEKLPAKQAAFFTQVRATRALDDQLKTCRSIAEVIALAKGCHVGLSAAELTQAAAVAAAIPGFSFEKLWFSSLGLM
jgi:predicted ribosomally synthesized peptide with nif11-like leader